MASHIGLDPAVLAQVTILRRAHADLASMMKVLGVSDEKEMLKSISAADRRLLPKGLHKKAKTASLLEEFVDALTPVEYAYFVVKGPLSTVLVKLCAENAKRWHDNAFMRGINL